MILAFVARGKKWIANSLLLVIYLEILIPSQSRAAVSITTPLENRAAAPVNISKNILLTTGLAALPKAEKIPTASVAATAEDAAFGGPTQPEMQAFHPAGADNMVDLFSGDFSYSIPLLDVGGYPITLGYNSGITMDQEASWVGLGWNINPGSITRNLRGIPDDFTGDADVISKETTIKENRTIGLTGDVGLEIAGLPQKGSGIGLDVGFTLGVFKNSYRGIGLETGLSASISAGNKTSGAMTGGLSIDNNSQNGITIKPSLSYKFDTYLSAEKGGYNEGVGITTGYNSRSGLSSLQLSGGISHYNAKKKDDAKEKNHGFDNAASISFAHPAYTPTITIPYTNSMTTLTLTAGGEVTVMHPNLSLSGYISRQYIADEDKRMSQPAYGYLNYEDASGNKSALLDFNRERDIPYRDVPAVPTIGVPAYTYDVFAMSGEGVGGSFRAYRNDVGYVYDHEMTTRDDSKSLSLDFGGGNVTHAGVDVFYTRAKTRTSAWEENNFLRNVLSFRKADKNFESSYFRSPGEKTINSTSFYDALGGDDVVAVRLSQILGDNTGIIANTTKLIPYKNGIAQPDITLTTSNTVKPAREKRTQSITYLTAKEASEVGLSKYIEYYRENDFSIARNRDEFQEDYIGNGSGLKSTYFYGPDFNTFMHDTVETGIDLWRTSEFKVPSNNTEYFSLQINGRLKVPFSGRYDFRTEVDDGVRFFLNGEKFIDDYDRGSWRTKDTSVFLAGGQLYDVKVDYRNYTAKAQLQLKWKSPVLDSTAGYLSIPPQFFFKPDNRTRFFVNNGGFYKEKRVTKFRKENHLSEIDVLNPDGRRYVYGIPVYNLEQKEATFSVNKPAITPTDGLINYTPNVDDYLSNKNGNDWYYNGEFMPAYAHSFLLTGILSPDYVDVTGNGISDDDAGNAIRFSYTRTASIDTPFMWRAPYNSKATYNEGLKTDNRDDKASYVRGSKELYYLHAVESKSMIAFFTIEKRQDMMQIDSFGNKTVGGARYLKQIDLYTKAEYLKNQKKAKPIKTVHFVYAYDLCKKVSSDTSGGKLTLKEVWFSYNGNEKGKKNAYKFRYNKLNPDYANGKYDRWGNYKDALQNPRSTSGNLITNADYPYALQDSVLAAQNAAAWVLDTIDLPSGGRITVDYESDDYGYVQHKRATQMLQVYGFSRTTPVDKNSFKPQLYELSGDNMYVGIKVPYAVKSNAEVYNRYLDNLKKLYFKLAVKVPDDKFGSGYEYVPVYADIDTQTYGNVDNGQIIWVKLVGITNDGILNGSVSPLAKAALQYLKLNLPSKAYPGSDVGGDIDGLDGLKVMFSQIDNISNLLLGFEKNARMRQWVREVDTTRSIVRINNPYYKKYGGGLRVKRVMTNDYWDKMTGQRVATYGKEYIYTTNKIVGTDTLVISSGVASYEPLLGGDENPWREPIEYIERVAALAPTTKGYVEEPLGEAFFPSASVGYSKVRVRTLNAKNNRSVNGYDETCFYTTKDFPTITERTAINDDTKKRFRHPLNDLLKIYVKHYLAVSQGFKIELNDMNGKVRSQASYAENDPDHWISYTENFYHVDNTSDAVKHLNNKVQTIDPKGVVQNSEIGKDVELMFDMRQQKSVTVGANVAVNLDIFVVGIWPAMVPGIIPLPQYEENRYQSVAATKVIDRHGVLDSVMVVDKGSRVVTQNLLFDTESGDPVLTSVQNEYNDKVFNFTYPAGWMYEGMSGAYKNIGVVLNGLTVNGGKIVGGLVGNITDYFFSGDEILAYAKQKVSGTDCNPDIAHWPGAYKLWAVDANMLSGGTPNIYFVNQDGTPFTGNDVSMKIIRSGRRNIAAAAGTVTMLKNPIVSNQLVLNDQTQVVSASMVEFKEFWKVPDRKMQSIIIDTFWNALTLDTVPITCGTVTQNVQIQIAAKTYYSVQSQAFANEMAKDFLRNNRYVMAARKIKCGFYYNTADTLYFKKDCGDPTATGDLVRYIIQAGTDSSLRSVTAANDIARGKAAIAGQLYANSTGRCYYKSMPKSGQFTGNCSSGTSTPVTYSLPWGADTSYTSQVAADAKATSRLATEGAAYAVQHSGCTYFARLRQTNIVFEDDLNDPLNYSRRGDIYVDFFKDEACTQSIVLGSTPVILEMKETEGTSTSTFNYNYVASGSSYLLKKNAFIKVSENPDPSKRNPTVYSFYYKLIIDPQYNIIVK